MKPLTHLEQLQAASDAYRRHALLAAVARLEQALGYPAPVGTLKALDVLALARKRAG